MTAGPPAPTPAPLPIRRPDAATARRLADRIHAAGDAADRARLEAALLRACGWRPQPPEGVCFLKWGEAPDGTEVLRGTEPRPLTDPADARALACALAPDAPAQDAVAPAPPPSGADPAALVAAALASLASQGQPGAPAAPRRVRPSSTPRTGPCSPDASG